MIKIQMAMNLLCKCNCEEGEYVCMVSVEALRSKYMSGNEKGLRQGLNNSVGGV